MENGKKADKGERMECEIADIDKRKNEDHERANQKERGRVKTTE